MALSLLGGSQWLLASLMLCSATSATDVETREFTVRVDGKPAGDAQMTIHRQDDGTLDMRCDTKITVKIGGFIKVYRYSYRGYETWKDGRLLHLRSTCDDDGKHYDVQAEAKQNGLQVSVNDVERMVSPDVWLTSYWQQPDKKKLETKVPLLDADCGRDLEAYIHFVTEEKRPIAGAVQKVQHFQLTGKVKVDLWYDEAGRLVRQEWMEDGHHTQMELKNLRR